MAKLLIITTIINNKPLVNHYLQLEIIIYGHFKDYNHKKFRELVRN